ncbi:MAG: Fic family protein [Rhodococcus sp. (in: high G+C Gram-positive bacteria)]|uniref:Fic family protein n=1 Tax=Rhodococcus sp. TaxID=1831 RepID=UPI003BB5EC0B
MPYVMEGALLSTIRVTDLAGVVHSAGVVFDGLATSRRDTESFLRSGRSVGVCSRSDLALLEDLRDVAQFIIDHNQPIDARYVRAVNTQISRSGALHPGRLRTRDQQIGVQTRYGRHTPPALTGHELDQLVTSQTRADDAEHALDLFVELAKAQPFEDGNKRTALFVANRLLIGHNMMLVVPVDEHDPRLADTFNDLLAKAYRRDEDAAVKDLLRTHGLTTIPH